MEQELTENNEPKLADNELVLGIDFGTTQIRAAIFKKNGRRAEVLRNPLNKTESFSSTIMIPFNNEEGNDAKNEENENKNEENKEEENKNEEIEDDNNKKDEMGEEEAVNEPQKQVEEPQKQVEEPKKEEEPKIKCQKLEDILKYDGDENLLKFPPLPDDDREPVKKEVKENPIKESENYNDEFIDKSIQPNEENANEEAKEENANEEAKEENKEEAKEENPELDKSIGEKANQDEEEKKEEDKKEEESILPQGPNEKDCIVITNIKKIIGCSFKNVQNEINKIRKDNDKKEDADGNKLLEIREGEKGTIKFIIAGKEYTPEDLLSTIIKTLIKVAEEKNLKEKGKDNDKEKVKGKVAWLIISVPISFNLLQRNAVKNAGLLCNIKNVKIINDPVASVLSYAYSNRCSTTENFLVVDFGASLFEATVISDKNNKYFKTLSIRGDSKYAGDYFTDWIAEYCKDEFLKSKKNRKQPKSDEIIQQLRNKSEEAKLKLSEENEYKIEVEKFDGTFDLNVTITRKKFEEKNTESFGKLKSIIQTVIKEAKESVEKYEKKKQKEEKTKAKTEFNFGIHHILLLGQSSNIPSFTEYIKNEFDGIDIITDEPNSICKGAAIYGAYFSNALKYGQIKELKLFGITLLSLGIRVQGDLMSVVIPRGSRIPIEARKSFVTTQDNQSVIKFEVFEGERKLVNDNTFLCRTVLKKLPQKRKGEVKVDVTFKLNDDGTLLVVANDGKTDVEVKQENIGNLTQEEIEKKLIEAEQNIENDKREEERIRMMIEFDNLLQEKSYEFDTDEDKKKIVEKYRNWMKHSPNATKEQFQEQYNQLIKECKESDGEEEMNDNPEEKKEGETPENPVSEGATSPEGERVQEVPEGEVKAE